MKKEICDRLKEARKQKGFKQNEMAEKLGISRAGYSRIENGFVELTTKNLLKIAEILEVSLDWLILGKEVDQIQQDFLSHFGKYAGSVELLFNDIKENESMMHGVLSYYFGVKGKEALENLSKKEKEKEQHV